MEALSVTISCNATCQGPLEDVAVVLKMPDMAYEEQLKLMMMQYPEFAIRKMLYLYVSPILIVIGTLGNLFSFIILRRKQMLKVSSYLYLASLAVIDTFVLYNGLLTAWVEELVGYDIQDSSDWLCKPLVTLGYVASDLSVWLIIAVTVERYIVVCFPFQASSMCNVSRAKKVIVCLFFLMLALNLHFFWTVEIVHIHGQCICGAGIPYRQLVEEIWPWVDILVYSLFPFVTITILNILIIKEVAGARSNRMLLSGSENDNSALSTTTPGNSCCVNPRRCNVGEGTRLTALLLTVSFTFLVLTLPNNIVMIITRLWNEPSRNLSALRDMTQFHLIKAITDLLMYTNHSINFFLYCATGNKFRQQIVDLFRCPWRRQGRGSNSFPNNQSLRRTSQSIISAGGGELLVVLRAEQRQSSLSSDMNVDSNDGGAENGRNVNAKLCSAGKISGKCGASFKPNKARNYGNDKNGNTCTGKPQHFIGNPRSLDEEKPGSNGSLRRCYGFSKTNAEYEQQLEEGVSQERVPNAGGSSRRSAPKPNNGCRIYFSSKRHKQGASSSKINFGSTEDISPRDREYILLQPTIRWCEASVQS